MPPWLKNRKCPPARMTKFKLCPPLIGQKHEGCPKDNGFRFWSFCQNISVSIGETLSAWGFPSIFSRNDTKSDNWTSREQWEKEKIQHFFNFFHFFAKSDNFWTFRSLYQGRNSWLQQFQTAFPLWLWHFCLIFYPKYINKYWFISGWNEFIQFLCHLASLGKTL